MAKTCFFCLNVEHDDTQGVSSVYPQYEGKWFCSTNCLCQHKDSGLRMNKSSRKSIRNRG